MSCKPLKGVLRSERRLVGKLASSRVLGPDGLYFDGSFEGVATGIYRDNVQQTHQFQDVLEELRVQHNPEHWASWALDGSLEEDRGQFPIVHQSPRLAWVPVGNRLGLSGTLNQGEFGFQCGTNTDFNYVHNEREFTVGLWANTKSIPVDVNLMGTNISSSTGRPGFTIFRVRGAGQIYLDMVGESYNRFATRTGVFDHPEFIVIRNFPAPANSLTTFSAAQPVGLAQPSGPGDFGDAFQPMSFLQGRSNPDFVPPIILNAFATNHILTDAEIYRLYVAGMADIMTF